MKARHLRLVPQKTAKKKPVSLDVVRELLSGRIREAVRGLYDFESLPDDLRLVRDLLQAVAFVAQHHDIREHVPRRAADVAAMAAAVDALTPSLGVDHRWYLSAAERAARLAKEERP
jgi:hypothetical protein